MTNLVGTRVFTEILTTELQGDMHNYIFPYKNTTHIVIFYFLTKLFEKNNIIQIFKHCRKLTVIIY